MVKEFIKDVVKSSIKDIARFVRDPINVQQEVFDNLIKNGKETKFGEEYNFNNIRTIEDFQKNVPIHNYDDLKPYFERILQNNEQNVLWNTPVKWFAMSSGTTSDKSKYIPVTKEALESCHYKGGRQMLGIYVDRHPETNFIFGKSLVLGGSRQINTLSSDVFTGDISAILVSNLPFWAKYSRVPDQKTILIPDWEEKLAKLTEKSIKKNVTSIAGVPSWILILLKYIEEKTNRKIPEIWPNLEVFFHGGVSFLPYVEQYKKILNKPNMNYWENYNASEGFFGIQYNTNSKDMILLLDSGVFYEFIPPEEWDKEQPKAIPLADVETGINYAIVITSNAGLWRYQIGDTIEFTSKYPYLFKFTGRTKLFINAFGEELIIDNAENALQEACAKTNSIIAEYTAAPIFIGDNSAGAHEWIIEFEKFPSSFDEFAVSLDNALKSVNSDYEAKRSHNLTLRLPQIVGVEKGTFFRWLKSKNKIGGQNKVPRLSNDRKYVDEIKRFIK
ncbi:MAG: GH3 auxin-responsive promoter family protein [Bacteroidales bacterium]|nr:GH3 auxin-responsive promoter family protein [Bacteroidales bacterium]